MPQKTWAVGEEVLAADLNTYVQNQVVATFANKATLDAYAPAAGAVAVTVDNGRVWQRYAGVWRLVAGPAPRFRVVGGPPGQAMSHGTVGAPTFLTEEVDTDGLIGSSGAFVCPATFPGVWRFDFSVSWAANTTGIRIAWLGITSTTTRFAHNNVPAAGTGANAMTLTGSADIALTAGQSVVGQMYHDGGVALNTNPFVYDYFQGRYLGPV